MEFEKWVDGYKVHVFPWIDGKNIYVNVQYFKPGTSISKPPVFDKSALIANDDAGKTFVYNLTSTCVSYIASLQIPSGVMAHIAVN